MKKLAILLRSVDPWDVSGISGLVCVCGGVWALRGPAWASILIGAVLVSASVVRYMKKGE
jgi:hypothetical protein